MGYYCCWLFLLFCCLLCIIDIAADTDLKRKPPARKIRQGRVKLMKFNNNQLCPMIGLGTWQGKMNTSESEQIEMYEAVKDAINIGYRHFDCSPIYNNEKYVGKAIAEKIKDGIIERKDIYVTSKLWNTKHDPKDVEGALRDSLKNLGLKYLDLYLMHWPFATTDDPIDSEGRCTGANISFIETWKAMEHCVQLGLTKSIGVANFNIKQLKDLLDVARIIPVVNQVENHPYLTQNKLKSYCQSKGIALMAYAPLGSPYRSPEQSKLFDVHFVRQLAFKHDKTPAQILLRFQIQRGIIAIPKSTNLMRLKENFEIWDFALTTHEVYVLQSVNRNLRFCVFQSAKHLKDYPFHETEYED